MSTESKKITAGKKTKISERLEENRLARPVVEEAKNLERGYRQPLRDQLSPLNSLENEIHRSDNFPSGRLACQWKGSKHAPSTC